jgi:hypothetical protein
LIEHMTIREVYGDWVTVQSDHFKSWRWSSDVTIQHNTFTFAGRQGLSVTSGQHVLIQDNHLDGAGQTMVDIEPDGPTTAAGPDGIPAHGGADDVRFISNDVGKADSLFFTVVGARANVNNVTIANNTLHGKALSMLILAYTELPRSNFLIENNTSDSPTQGVYGGGMIRLRNITKAVIRNNVGPVGDKPAVTVNGSKDVTVADNQFPGSTTLLLVDQPPRDFSLEKPATKAEWSATGSAVVHCGNSYGPAGSQADGRC